MTDFKGAASIAVASPKSTPVMLVTGGNRGIGQALASSFSRTGYDVIACSRRPPDEKPNYDHRIVDVTDERAVVALIKDVRRTYRRLDVLVNNAGQARMNMATLATQGAAEQMFRVNSVAAFVVAREAAKVMRASAHGRIINMTSVAVPLALAGEALYAASKAAVETLTRALAREFGGLGITVNAVGPTVVDTNLTRGIPPQAIEQLLNMQAIPRKASFEDVINVVRFFADHRSDLVTGQVLYLGGVW